MSEKRALDGLEGALDGRMSFSCPHVLRESSTCS